MNKVTKAVFPVAGMGTRLTTPTNMNIATGMNTRGIPPGLTITSTAGTSRKSRT